MKVNRILLLGGTEDARQIADSLAEWLAENFAECQIIYSLAGITKQPTLPAQHANITLRQGGFGAQFENYLKNINAVIDATHPFATQISENIAHACAKLNISLIHYRRQWQILPHWQMAQDNKTMMLMIKNHPQAHNILVALGGKKIEILLPYFAAYQDKKFYLRVIESAFKPLNLPQNCNIITADLPFTAQKEADLLKNYNINLILCRHSGAESVLQKLIIAEKHHIPIIMLQQPILPNYNHPSCDTKHKVIDFIKNCFLS
ncbi:MAG: precorrin-6A/cobalt-precorrin-6A reductase [Alphaproteobacteria bacterium]|nr:precorrin-6A/cobalt-precorrin-6A reductase [Alphaproteobacteria bacterium]